MARKRKTLADYLVIALCPLLIMALVGSVAFFLLELIYQGPWSDRLRWVLFWFVFATVLISRIAIVQGSTYARGYGIFLALATGGLIYRLIGVTFAGWGLLAFIWWCTSKLTWDCTLVDDNEDASGEGLLQVAGLETSPAEPAANENPRAGVKAKKRWGGWNWFAKKSVKRGDKPHAPGSWVIYFSLLALPTFGIGQAFFPTEDAVQREYGFKLLWIYVAAALGLMLATSFLGLRRYLRQRSLAMPSAMAGRWIVLGSLLAGAIMLVCLLLPRPDSSRTVTRMVEKVAEEAAKQASKYAALSGQAGKGEGRRMGSGENKAGEEAKENGKSGEPKSEGEPESDKPKSQPDKEKTPEETKEKEKADPQGKNGQPREPSEPTTGSPTNQPPAQPPTKSKDFGWVATAIKWLIYSLLIGAALYALYRFRRAVAATLRQMGATLREMFASLFGWWRRTPDEPVVSSPGMASGVPVPARPFSSLANPFTTGGVEHSTPAELVTCTFNALQVWAAERGLKRLPDQTPLEFAGQLGETIPLLGEEARTVALLYTRIAYAQHQPSPDCLEDLARLWDAMEK